MLAMGRGNGHVWGVKKLTLIVALMSLLMYVPAGESAPAQGRPANARVARGKLVHMVSFKFKESATPEQIKEVETAFQALKGKIPQIVSLEWGTNNSPEKLNKGFTHGYVLTFNNEKDRDAYLVHPDHKAFGGLVGPVLADVFVLDFLAKN